ncbi:class C sortase [Ruminococcus flavefaciens]|uniref:class C sortase n=1 Tax=Ruminococcus flavefaciens TaxID=1265 RepID=UPI0026EDA686|nr:class C sortase [Ruminococcus flavefaciens]MDD7516206.1 class C sortase [Ruminococcus flavefaciens]MDY5692454.1 class C sortase [Ruminococcus flavefaciens]
MKHIIVKLLPFAALFIGVFLLLYPTVSEHINALHRSRAIRNYNEIAESLSDEEHDRIIEAAREYNKKLAEAENPIIEPEKVHGYNETLDITGTGIMGYVTIDKIKVELPIYHGVDDNVLQIAAGHLPGSSLPIGGKGTHAVLSGHRGLPSARLFTDLDKLEEGDIFRITVMSDVLTYQIDQIKTVKPYEIEDLKIDPNKDLCTLFTCTPYGINSHRLLVRGVRVETKEEYKVYVANDVFIVSPLIVAPVIAAPILLVLLILLMIKGRKK